MQTELEKKLGITPTILKKIARYETNIVAVQQALIENKEGIKQFFKLGFNPTDLSRIFRGGGGHSAAGIVLLTDGLYKLEDILTTTQYTTQDLTQMFYTSCHNIGNVIDAVYKHKALLVEMIKSKYFNSEHIGKILYGSRHYIGNNIIALGSKIKWFDDFIERSNFNSDIISTLLWDTSSKLQDILNEIQHPLEELDQFINESEFTCINISSILCSPKIRTIEAIEQFLNYRSQLINFTDNTMFSAQNISGILAKSRGDVGEVIRQLMKHKDDLTTLSTKAKFSPSNISSILGCSRINLSTNIDVLLKAHDDLVGMQSIGLSASNISNILSYSAKSLEINIRLLLDNKERVKSIMQQFDLDGKDISTILGRSCNKLDQILSDLESASKKINKFKSITGYRSKDIFRFIFRNVQNIPKEVTLLCNELDIFHQYRDMGFLSSDISMIAYMKIYGNIQIKLDTLKNLVGPIEKLVKISIFSTNQISRLLLNSNLKIDTSINVLLKYNDSLSYFIKESNFLSEDIFNILNISRGYNLENQLVLLIQNKALLQKLEQCTGLTAKQISLTIHYSNQHTDRIIKIIDNKSMILKSHIEKYSYNKLQILQILNDEEKTNTNSELESLGFTKAHISYIAVCYNNIKLVERELALNIKVIKLIISYGFTAQQIYLMARGTGSQINLFIQKINHSSSKLETVIINTKWNCNDLSSLLDQSGLEIDQVIDQLYDNQNALIELGRNSHVSKQQIAFILRYSKTCLGKNIQIISYRIREFEKLFKTTVLTAYTVFSMLGNIGSNLEFTLNNIIPYLEELNLLLKHTSFTNSHLSHLFGASGKDIIYHIRSFLHCKKEIINLIDSTDFTAQSITNILRFNRRSIDSTIAILIKHKADLNELIQNGIFSANSLCTILTNSNNNLEHNISLLLKYQDELTLFALENELNKNDIMRLIHKPSIDLGISIKNILVLRAQIHKFKEVSNFTVKQISKLLSRNIQKDIKYLIDNHSIFHEIRNLGLDSEDISNILNDRGKYAVEEKLRILISAKDSLSSLIKISFFSKKQICSLLSMAITKLQININILIKNNDHFLHFIQESNFRSMDIYYTLGGGGGSNLKENIISFVKCKNRLNALEAKSKFNASQINRILICDPKNNLEERISALEYYFSWLNEYVDKSPYSVATISHLLQMVGNSWKARIACITKNTTRLNNLVIIFGIPQSKIITLLSRCNTLEKNLSLLEQKYGHCEVPTL